MALSSLLCSSASIPFNLPTFYRCNLRCRLLRDFSNLHSYLELLVWCRPGLLIQFRWTGFRMSWIFILSRISWRLSWLIWGLIPSNRAEHIWKYLEIGPDPGDWTACQTSSSLTGIWWPVRLGLVKSDVLRKDQYRSICRGRISSWGRTAPPSDLCDACRHRHPVPKCQNTKLQKYKYKYKYRLIQNTKICSVPWISSKILCHANSSQLSQLYLKVGHGFYIFLQSLSKVGRSSILEWNRLAGTGVATAQKILELL